MSYRELFVSPSPTFSGSQTPYEKADYVVLGVPLDMTSTYRSGTRFAPLAIREASLNIETYSFRAGLDMEDLKLHDLGDVHVAGDLDETLRRLELVTRDVLRSHKTLVTIGGEHTVTLGVVRGIAEVEKDVAVVSFDAHLDLRNEYMGRSLSHTTFMRRLDEQIDPAKILEIGTRAVCKEELDHAKKSNIEIFTVQRIRKDGVEETKKNISESLAERGSIYLTIDMDVLDPAFAPAVQNPEPEGLHIDQVLDILDEVCSSRVLAFDLVEVTPHYDHGTTAIQAARIIFEVLSQIEKTRRR